MDMKVNIAGVEWKNPVTVASGTFGSGEEFSEFVDLNRLGAVTTKGVANVPWPGNPTPRVAEVYGGMMNAIGLQNPGIDLFCKRDIPFLKKYDTKIIVNVCGHAPEEYLAVVERLADEPIDMMEINISCPNVNLNGIFRCRNTAHSNNRNVHCLCRLIYHTDCNRMYNWSRHTAGLICYRKCSAVDINLHTRQCIDQ